MSNKSYRIRTDVNGEDKVLKVNLKQGIKTLNILSLEINPEDLYELHTSDYGVIVGRVLANEAMGIPNVKISVFVPIDDADKNDYIIANEYPYTTPQSKDINGVKYNLLVNKEGTPGTFPSKKMLLDNDGCVEVFDKYWKYTTTSNESGDYMIFGVPTGSCQIHYDCDLSDIGMLSQHPYDLIAKGYSELLFDDVSKFTEKDLDRSVHIISQDITTYVYPFWGDKTKNQIGITRNDINVNYKFEPSCVFMGSSITDPVGSYIDEYGKPNGVNGVFDSLETSTGDIEVIRKKEDGTVEELKDNVWGIINGNGVWCYQIPMNLDRIGTDEYGNMIAINDPTKGIPTRARVRFRISLTSGQGGVGGNTARMLIPCNPKLMPSSHQPYPGEYDGIYEFGTNTPDKHFRDLYWGKVYSVRQFYTRFHYEDFPKSVMRYVEKEDCYDRYSDFLVDLGDWDGPEAVMYNYRGYPPQFAFKQSCISSCDMVDGLNLFPYTTLYGGPEVAIDYSVGYWFYYHMSEDTGNERMTEKGLHFCFENDWVNGCLYFPRFAVSKNGSRYFGSNNDYSFNGRYDNVYISGRHYFYYDNGLYGVNGGGFTTKIDDAWWWGGDPNDHPTECCGDDEVQYTWFNEDKVWTFTRADMACGIVTKKKTMLGESVYYYRCCGTPGTGYSRIYPTDIILLGNLEDIYDFLPHLHKSLPDTSAFFPPIGTNFKLNESGMSKQCFRDQILKAENHDTDLTDVFGNYTTMVGDESGYRYSYWRTTSMWGDKYESDEYISGLTQTVPSGLSTSCYDRIDGSVKHTLLWQAYRTSQVNTPIFGLRTNWVQVFNKLLRWTSLFFDVVIPDIYDLMGYDIPSFINLSRICELGVGNDKERENGLSIPNGIIDATDIENNYIRSIFARMNYDINRYAINEFGNRQPLCTPMTITGFDGRLKKFVDKTHAPNADEKIDRDYVRFRFGDIHVQEEHVFYPTTDACKSETYAAKLHHAINYANGPLYLPDNSFYFYFGLRAGATAITELRKKYTGVEDDSNIRKIGSVSVVAQDDNQYCIDGIQYGTIKIYLYDVEPPIKWNVYDNDIVVQSGVTDYSEDSRSGFTSGRNYKFIGTDSYGNEYEQWFMINSIGVTCTIDFMSYDPEAEMNRLRITTINENRIEHVIRVQDDFINGECGDYGGIDVCSSGGSGYRIYLSTYDDHGYSSFGRYMRLAFEDSFEYWILDDSNGWIDIYFPQTTTSPVMQIGVYRDAEYFELGKPCPTQQFDINFPYYAEASLKLNDVPVFYISGWKKQEYWEPSSIDVPDSVFQSDFSYERSYFNLFDSMNAAHPDYAITKWINRNNDVDSCNRGYDFTNAEGTSEQLCAISNMFAAVNGDFGMSLKYNSGSNINTNNDKIISISPYYSGISSYINTPETSWGDPITGDVQYLSVVNIENTEGAYTVIDGDNIFEVYSQYDKRFPHIVGSNYPREIDTRTMLRSGVEDLIIGYMNNETILMDNASTYQFSLNSFGLRSGVYYTLDKPSELYPRNDLVTGACKYEVSDYKGYFGVRTVDRRFDYRFAAQTPLLLPSGYDNFSRLDRKALMAGVVDIDLYGGIRLNRDSENNITCYRTAGDVAVEKFFGMDDNTKKRFIGNYFAEEANTQYNDIRGDNNAEIRLFKQVAGELCEDDILNGLFNTRQKIIDKYAEDWAIARYHRISGSSTSMQDWLKSSYDSSKITEYDAATDIEKSNIIGSAATDYITAKLESFTSYDAKRYWLTGKFRDSLIEKYGILERNGEYAKMGEWFLTYYNVNGGIHALTTIFGDNESILLSWPDAKAGLKPDYQAMSSDDERLRYIFANNIFTLPSSSDTVVYNGALYFTSDLLENVYDNEIDLVAFNVLSEYYNNLRGCQDEWLYDLLTGGTLTDDDIIAFNRSYDRRNLVISDYHNLLSDFDDVTLSAQTLYLSGLTHNVYNEENIEAIALSWLSKNSNTKIKNFLSEMITNSVISAECKSIRDTLNYQDYDDLIGNAYSGLVSYFSNGGTLDSDGLTSFNEECYGLNDNWVRGYYSLKYQEFSANVLQSGNEWLNHEYNTTASTISAIIEYINTNNGDLNSFYESVISTQINYISNIVIETGGQSSPGGNDISSPIGDQSSPDESIGGGVEPSPSNPSSPHSVETRIVRKFYNLIYELSSGIINYWKENTSLTCDFIEKLFDGVYGYIDHNNTYKYGEKLYDIIEYDGIRRDIMPIQTEWAFKNSTDALLATYNGLTASDAKEYWIAESTDYDGPRMWFISRIFSNKNDETAKWISADTNSQMSRELAANLKNTQHIWKKPGDWAFQHGAYIISEKYRYLEEQNSGYGNDFVINEYVNYMKNAILGNKEGVCTWMLDVLDTDILNNVFIGGGYDTDGSGHYINGYCEYWLYDNFDDFFKYYDDEQVLEDILNQLNYDFSDANNINAKRSFVRGSISGIFQKSVINAVKNRINDLNLPQECLNLEYKRGFISYMGSNSTIIDGGVFYRFIQICREEEIKWVSENSISTTFVDDFISFTEDEQRKELISAGGEYLYDCYVGWSDYERNYWLPRATSSANGLYDDYSELETSEEKLAFVIENCPGIVVGEYEDVAEHALEEFMKYNIEEENVLEFRNSLIQRYLLLEWGVESSILSTYDTLVNNVKKWFRSYSEDYGEYVHDTISDKDTWIIEKLSQLKSKDFWALDELAQRYWLLNRAGNESINAFNGLTEDKKRDFISENGAISLYRQYQTKKLGVGDEDVVPSKISAEYFIKKNAGESGWNEFSYLCKKHNDKRAWIKSKFGNNKLHEYDSYFEPTVLEIVKNNNAYEFNLVGLGERGAWVEHNFSGEKLSEYNSYEGGNKTQWVIDNSTNSIDATTFSKTTDVEGWVCGRAIGWLVGDSSSSAYTKNLIVSGYTDYLENEFNALSGKTNVNNWIKNLGGDLGVYKRNTLSSDGMDNWLKQIFTSAVTYHYQSISNYETKIEWVCDSIYDFALHAFSSNTFQSLEIENKIEQIKEFFLCDIDPDEIADRGFDCDCSELEIADVEELTWWLRKHIDTEIKYELDNFTLEDAKFNYFVSNYPQKEYYYNLMMSRAYQEWADDNIDENKRTGFTNAHDKRQWVVVNQGGYVDEFDDFIATKQINFIYDLNRSDRDEFLIKFFSATIDDIKLDYCIKQYKKFALLDYSKTKSGDTGDNIELWIRNHVGEAYVSIYNGQASAAINDYIKENGGLLELAEMVALPYNEQESADLQGAWIREHNGTWEVLKAKIQSNLWHGTSQKEIFAQRVGKNCALSQVAELETIEEKLSWAYDYFGMSYKTDFQNATNTVLWKTRLSYENPTGFSSVNAEGISKKEKNSRVRTLLDGRRNGWYRQYYMGGAVLEKDTTVYEASLDSHTKAISDWTQRKQENFVYDAFGSACVEEIQYNIEEKKNNFVENFLISLIEERIKSKVKSLQNITSEKDIIDALVLEFSDNLCDIAQSNFKLSALSRVHNLVYDSSGEQAFDEYTRYTLTHRYGMNARYWVYRKCHEWAVNKFNNMPQKEKDDYIRNIGANSVVTSFFGFTQSERESWILEHGRQYGINYFNTLVSRKKDDWIKEHLNKYELEHYSDSEINKYYGSESDLIRKYIINNQACRLVSNRFFGLSYVELFEWVYNMVGNSVWTFFDQSAEEQEMSIQRGTYVYLPQRGQGIGYNIAAYWYVFRFLGVGYYTMLDGFEYDGSYYSYLTTPYDLITKLIGLGRMREYDSRYTDIDGFRDNVWRSFTYEDSLKVYAFGIGGELALTWYYDLFHDSAYNNEYVDSQITAWLEHSAISYENFIENAGSENLGKVLMARWRYMMTGTNYRFGEGETKENMTPLLTTYGADLTRYDFSTMHDIEKEDFIRQRGCMWILYMFKNAESFGYKNGEELLRDMIRKTYLRQFKKMRDGYFTEKEKRDFVYEMGGGNAISGGPQRGETQEGAHDWANLWSYEIGESHGENSCLIDVNKITENKINIWDFFSDIIETYNSSDAYLYEYIPAYTFQSDIDHVKYSITDINGDEMSGGTSSFVATFTDCSTDFRDGKVKSGNTESFGISYDSGVNLSCETYDVEYTLDGVNGTLKEYYASLSGSDLTITLKPDDVWFGGSGVTYTDINTSGNDNTGVYPNWAAMTDGDIPEEVKRELAVYVCEPNLLTQDGFTVNTVYPLTQYLNAAIHYDNSVGIAPFGVSDDVIDGFFNKTLEEQEEFVITKAGEEGVNKLETLTDEELYDYVVELGKYASNTEFGLLTSEEDKESWVRNSVCDYVKMLLNTENVGTDSASQIAFMNMEFGEGSADGFPESDSYNQRISWICTKSGDIMFSSLSGSTEEARRNFILSSASDMLEFEFGSLPLSQSEQNDWVAKYTDTPEEYEIEGDTRWDITELATDWAEAEYASDKNALINTVCEGFYLASYLEHINSVQLEWGKEKDGYAGQDDYTPSSWYNSFSIQNDRISWISNHNPALRQSIIELTNNAKSDWVLNNFGEDILYEFNRKSSDDSKLEFIRTYGHDKKIGELNDLISNVESNWVSENSSEWFVVKFNEAEDQADLIYSTAGDATVYAFVHEWTNDKQRSWVATRIDSDVVESYSDDNVNLDEGLSFKLDDTDPSLLEGELPYNSFIIIPTRKVYRKINEPTSLKQGVVYNRGYVYYTGSISAQTENDTVKLMLNSPLRNENGVITYSSETLSNEYGWHTIGNVTDIYIDSNTGVNVSYDNSRCEFTISNLGGNTDIEFFFTIENGLRYKISLNLA